MFSSIHTNSINFTFLSDTKIWKRKFIAKRLSPKVTRCHQMSGADYWRTSKKKKEAADFYRKSTKFIPDRTIRPFQVKRYGIDNQCNGTFCRYCLWMYGRYWRKTCGKVLCQYAAACGEREDREKLMRYAIIAGIPMRPVVCLDLSGTV